MRRAGISLLAATMLYGAPSYAQQSIASNEAPLSLFAGRGDAQPSSDLSPGGMPAMPSMAETAYNSLVEIADGALSANKFANDRIISAGMVEGLQLRSAEPAQNGIIIRGGRSAVTLRKNVISLSGAGTNDFLGTGAGVLVRDGAAAVLLDQDITTSARVSSALVVAENATARVYGSRLVAHGGPLPEGYKPRIGPGMLEPPAPLGLSGTARTLLVMSNSRTFLYDTLVEADGWGALSTDATGGNLYLEANDCDVRVKGKGYGVYADFGAHVVVNRSQVESGSDVAIIAGKARIDLNQVNGKAVRSGVMIHSVMASDPAEAAELDLLDTNLNVQGPIFLVKSANAAIHVVGGELRSGTGVLLDVRKNDDPNATKTSGRAVPGVELTVERALLKGDVVDSDPDRPTVLVLAAANLTGRLKNVLFKPDRASRWHATADSSVTLASVDALAAIDAPPGVTVTVMGQSVSEQPRTLPAGGRLLLRP